MSMHTWVGAVIKIVIGVVGLAFILREVRR